LHLQHRVDELPALDAQHVGPRVVVERERVRHQLLARAAAEGWPPGEHLVQRRAERPHVRRRAKLGTPPRLVRVVPGELLGRRVERGAHRQPGGLLLDAAREAPVDEHLVVGSGQQKLHLLAEPEASSSRHGWPPSCSGGAPGCV
jgi:hypothetical protein